MLFLFAGILFGLFMGLIPGIHPNTIILAIPVLMTLSITPICLLVFIVAMAITNVVSDFIPSILFGAPDSDSGLAVLPGHKMLMRGNGYEAIKLALLGCVGSVLICVALLPLIIFAMPGAYEAMKPFMHFILIAFVAVMIISEKDNRHRILGLFCFFLAGFVGLLSFQLPIDKTLILFPIFSLSLLCGRWNYCRRQ